MKILFLAGFVFLVQLNAQAAKKELWIYTSVYKEFIGPIEKAFEAKHPEVDVQVYQGGSEKIQAKLEAELSAGKPKADILMTSDPFWSRSLVKRGLSLSRKGKNDLEENYISLMVLIVHRDLAPEKRPSSFSDLNKPEFQGLIQMASPLESGTAFSTVAYLQNKFGWAFFEGLKKNKISSSGGNSTVIQKVESGEKKVGIVLLENALAAKKRGSPIEVVYPADGSIPIPSVQVILKSTPVPDLAFLFSDFILSNQGQGYLLNGYMYSVLKSVAAPEGAEPLAKVTKKSTPWTPELLEKIGSNSKEIKKKFSELILE
jgi:iron(III) transport system substrate-binding protein